MSKLQEMINKLLCLRQEVNMFCFQEGWMAGELGVVEKKEDKENVGAGDEMERK